MFERRKRLSGVEAQRDGVICLLRLGSSIETVVPSDTMKMGSGEVYSKRTLPGRLM